MQPDDLRRVLEFLVYFVEVLADGRTPSPEDLTEVKEMITRLRTEG
jgi:hypothetical protein